MEKVQIGIIGLGNIAQTIHLPILSKMPDLEIAALCDIDKPKVQFLAKKFGVKRYYTDWQEMLAQEQEITGIDLCTSTFTHSDIARGALEAGKHVFVEKPLARSAKEAQTVVDCGKAANKTIMVGMNNRFRPDAMILKNFIRGGELGKIYYVKTGWLKKLSTSNPWLTRKAQSGGGVVLDLGIVMLDLAFWMMSYPDVKEVDASMYSQNTKSVEDSAIAYIRMKNGSTITLVTSWSFESEENFFYCDCYGMDGSGSLNPFRIYKKMHGSLVNVAPAAQETGQQLYRRSYYNELKHWGTVLQGRHPVVSTGEEAVHRMKVVDALYRSAKAGKAIKIQ